jgi:hypothetical protein
VLTVFSAPDVYPNPGSMMLLKLTPSGRQQDAALPVAATVPAGHALPTAASVLLETLVDTAYTHLYHTLVGPEVGYTSARRQEFRRPITAESALEIPPPPPARRSREPLIDTAAAAPAWLQRGAHWIGLRHSGLADALFSLEEQRWLEDERATEPPRQGDPPVRQRITQHLPAAPLLTIDLLNLSKKEHERTLSETLFNSLEPYAEDNLIIRYQAYVEDARDVAVIHRHLAELVEAHLVPSVVQRVLEQSKAAAAHLGVAGSNEMVQQCGVECAFAEIMAAAPVQQQLAMLHWKGANVLEAEEDLLRGQISRILFPAAVA